MPDLFHYQLRNGPHAGEPTTERGEIERLARECLAAECLAGLDSTVVETRFNVVRSPMPAMGETARKLRDYLRPVDHPSASARAEGRLSRHTLIDESSSDPVGLSFAAGEVSGRSR